MQDFVCVFFFFKIPQQFTKAALLKEKTIVNIY